MIAATRLLVVGLLISFLFVNCFETYSQTLELSSRNSISTESLIDNAFNNKEISINKWILFRTYLFFDDSKLPDKYKTGNNKIDATFYFKAILNNWSKFNSETRNELRLFGIGDGGTMSRPESLDKSLETEHFKIYYTTDTSSQHAILNYDNNQNGNPDYVDHIADAFEKSWRYELDTLGCLEPPISDDDDEKYHIYICKHYDTGGYGATYGEITIVDNPNSEVVEEFSMTSYITIRNEYDHFDDSWKKIINVTAAHEFLHAIHYGYDSKMHDWICDGTSTWVEDQVFPDVNDCNQYLPTILRKTHYPLDTLVGTRQYSVWLFFEYLSEHTNSGNKIVKSILENCVGNTYSVDPTNLSAINKALDDDGTNFRDQFVNFWTANIIKTKPPYDYQDGADFPAIKFQKNLFGSPFQKTNKIALKLSANIYRVSQNVVPDGSDEIAISFDPKYDYTEFTLVLITKSYNDSINVRKFYTDSAKVEFEIENSNNYKDMILAVINTDLANPGEYELIYTTTGRLFKLTDDNILIGGDYDKGYYTYTTVSNYSDKTLSQINYYSFWGGYNKTYDYYENTPYTTLAVDDGDMTIALKDFQGATVSFIGVDNLSFKILATDPFNESDVYPHFDDYKHTQVGNNKAIFFAKKNPTNDPYNTETGIWEMALNKSDPKKLVAVSEQEYINAIDYDNGAFVYEKISYSNNTEELILFTENFTEGIFSTNLNDGDVRKYDFKDSIITWFEWSKTDNNQKIKYRTIAYNAIQTLVESQNTEYDNISIATNSKRIIWAKKQGTISSGTWWLYYWENGIINEFRTTTKFVMQQDDNKRMSLSEDGVAWIEIDQANWKDYILYYYDFSNSVTYQFTLNNKFGVNPHITIHLSSDFLVLEVLENEGGGGLGVYYAALGDIQTGVEEPVLKSEVNYVVTPNPATEYIEIKTNNLESNLRLVPSRIEIFDVLGRKVDYIIQQKSSPLYEEGTKGCVINVSHLLPGIYFVRVGDEFLRFVKM